MKILVMDAFGDLPKSLLRELERVIQEMHERQDFDGHFDSNKYSGSVYTEGACESPEGERGLRYVAKVSRGNKSMGEIRFVAFVERDEESEEGIDS